MVRDRGEAAPPRGKLSCVRFADDAIMAFDNIVDAQRILAVLGKRLERFGLTLHPDKTRLVDFRPLMTESTRHPETDGTNFGFLGFTHVWGRSRKGKKMVRQITAKSRLAPWPRRATGVGNTGTCRYATSIATFPQRCGATSPIMASAATFDDCEDTPTKPCGHGRNGCPGEIAKASSPGRASTKS